MLSDDIFYKGFNRRRLVGYYNFSIEFFYIGDKFRGGGGLGDPEVITSTDEGNSGNPLGSDYSLSDMYQGAS